MPQSKTAVELELSTDTEQWDRLVRANRGATGIHSSAWLDFQSDLLGVTIERRVATRSGVPIGVMPVVRGGRGLLPQGLPFPFLGPLVPDDAVAETVVAVRRLQRTLPMIGLHYEFGALQSSPALERTLREAGADVRPDSTVVVELNCASVDDLRRRYHANRRNNLRRADRQGVVVRVAEHGEFGAIIPALLDESYTAHGRSSPYPSDLGTRFEQWARGRDDVSVIVATIEDRVVGALAVLTGYPVAALWIGGALREVRSSFASVALHDRMLTDALGSGHERLDMCGWVDDSIGEYKTSFGGARQTYLVADSWLLPSRALDLARLVTREARRIRHGRPEYLSATRDPG